MAERYWRDDCGVDFPCKGCTERHHVCWSECEKYKQAKQAQSEKNRFKAKKRQTDLDYFMVRIKRSHWMVEGDDKK